MTPEILLVMGILVVVIAVLVTEIMPLEVLALLVLGVLAVTGLVSPVEALSGFSNPAVVTIWAVFILSGGLTRTGIANILGRYLLRVAGSGSSRMMILIMVISGGLSAFMNNVAVAALMLPVVMDICRKTGHSPSLMLMPLARSSRAVPPRFVDTLTICYRPKQTICIRPRTAPKNGATTANRIDGPHQRPP